MYDDDTSVLFQELNHEQLDDLVLVCLYYRNKIIPSRIWSRYMFDAICYYTYKDMPWPPLFSDLAEERDYIYLYHFRLGLRGHIDLFYRIPGKAFGISRKKIEVLYNKNIYELEKLKKSVGERLFRLLRLRVSEGTFRKEKGIIERYNLKKGQILSTQIGTEDLTKALSDYEKMIKAKFNSQKHIVATKAKELTDLAFSELSIPLISRRARSTGELMFRENVLMDRELAIRKIIRNYTQHTGRYKKQVNVNVEQKELYAVYFKNGYLEKQGTGLTGDTLQEIKIEPIEHVISAIAESNSFSNVIFVPIFLMLVIFSRFVVEETRNLFSKKKEVK